MAVPKNDELERAGTFVSTPNSDTSTYRQGDIVIRPMDVMSATKNLLDYDYAIRYYPNCNDIMYAEKYKPYNEVGLHLYDPKVYSTGFDWSEADKTSKARAQKIFDSLKQNPNTPGNIAYAKILKETGSVVPANAERNKLNNELFSYVFNLLQSKRCVFVYSHPQFGLNWDNLIEKAKYENLDTYFSEIQRALFNAECLIRFTDPAYVTLFREAGFRTDDSWKRQDFSFDPKRIENYARRFNNEAYHNNFKYIAPNIDREYNNLNRKEGDLPAYERFLQDYGYITVRTKERDR